MGKRVEIRGSRAVGLAAACLLALGTPSAVSAEAGEEPASPPAVSEAPPADARTVTGTVVLAARSAAGAPRSVEVVAEDGTRYKVREGGDGEALADHVGHEVTITGSVRANPDGIDWLEVERFEVHGG